MPSWSRDGHWIYFASIRSGTSQVWKMRTDGSGAVQITKQGGFAALESRDGAFLYYSKVTPHGYALWRVPMDGGEEVEIVRAIPHWSTFAPVAQGIYFISRREPTASASIQFLDGQTLLYTQIDQEGSDLMLVEHFH